MIEKDYISRILQQLALAMSGLLELEKDRDQPEMELVVCDALREAGIDPDDPEIGKTGDDRILVSLSELISVYLATGGNGRLSRIDDLISERLSERKSFILKI